MIFHWDEIPIIRILIPLIVGIFIAVQIHLAVPSLLLPIALLIVFLMGINLSKFHTTFYRQRWLFGALMFVLFTLIGYELTYQKTDILKADHFSHHLSDSTFTVFKIEEPLVEKANSYKAEVSILEVWNADSVQQTKGKAIVYFQKDSVLQKLKYGDIVLTGASFQAINPPKNPHEFDYRRYLQLQNIYHQVYIPQGDWQLTGHNQASALYKLVYGARLYFLRVLEQNIKGADEMAVASALLLGYKHFLEAELKQTYSQTGAMHVLAVSGLHVGIIYLIINLFLRFLDKRGRRGIFLKAGLVLLIIWSFALLTGLPPSVARAAVMFSFFTIAKLFDRTTNPYNIIATSALGILIVEPYMLFQVGFQLSYAALTGIIFLQPKIYAWFTVRNYLIDKIWQITAVSLAAQMATAPFSLYYFHQFPTYFLLSNLIVIPAATVILFAGIMLFVFSFVHDIFVCFIGEFTPLISGFIGMALNTFIALQNFLLEGLQYLPYAAIKGISINIPEFVLMYAFMACMIAFFMRKQVFFLKASLGVAIVAASGLAIQRFEQVQQREILVYHINKGTAIDFIDGNQSYMISDTSGGSKDKIGFHIQQNWWKMGVANLQKYGLSNYQADLSTPLLMKATPLPSSVQLAHPFVQFYDKKMLILSDAINVELLTQNVAVDYLVLTQNVKVDLEKLQEKVDFKIVVFDASNGFWKINTWKEQCEVLNKPFYDVKTDGAFRLSL